MARPLAHILSSPQLRASNASKRYAFKENHPMITNIFQRKAYNAVSPALPFAIDPAKITVELGVSYLPSPIKLHDYAAGVMAAFGSVVEYLGRVRGLPSQTMTHAKWLEVCNHIPRRRSIGSLN